MNLYITAILSFLFFISCASSDIQKIQLNNSLDYYIVNNMIVDGIELMHGDERELNYSIDFNKKIIQSVYRNIYFNDDIEIIIIDSKQNTYILFREYFAKIDCVYNDNESIECAILDESLGSRFNTRFIASIERSFQSYKKLNKTDILTMQIMINRKIIQMLE